MGVSSSASSQGMDRFSSSSCLFPDVEKVSSGDPGKAHLNSGVQRRVGQIIILEKYYVIFLFIFILFFTRSVFYVCIEYCI